MLPARAGALALVLLGVSGLAGCVTVGRHEQLEQRVTQLELERKRLKASMTQDVSRIEKLHDKLVVAEQTLRKSGVNLGIRTEKLESDYRKVRGELEAAAFNLRKIRGEVALLRKSMIDKLGVLELLLPADLPRDADGMWAAAKKHKSAGDTQIAHAIYKTFESTFPKDKRAPKAALAIARIAEEDGDIQGAIKVYANVEERYPGSPEVPKAILRIGELLVKQGQCQKARGIYQYLARTHKNTREGRIAAQRVREVMRTCKPK